MTPSVLLYPFSEYWWFYACFLLFVLVMLLMDLGIFHRKAHKVSIRESVSWTIVWISLALIFNVILYFYSLQKFQTDGRLLAIPGFDGVAAAKQVALEFLTGFIIEKSLAVDNIFVFVVLFSYFAIPPIYQHKILFYGILGALVFRAFFIALGATLLQYHWVVLVAGVFLIFTGIKILISPEKVPDPGHNPLLKIIKVFFRVTPEFKDGNFFIIKDGKKYATPLFVALVFIEFSDIIFAIDSVPAIFAITKEPFIVFTSNIFAILGLRSLYFLLAGVVEKFRFLKFGLGFILIFVGLKMAWLNEVFDGKFPTLWSLGIIGTVLAISIGASLIFKPKLKIPKGQFP